MNAPAIRAYNLAPGQETDTLQIAEVGLFDLATNELEELEDEMASAELQQQENSLSWYAREFTSHQNLQDILYLAEMTATTPVAWDDEHDALLLDALDQAVDKEAAYAAATAYREHHPETWEEAADSMQLPKCPDALEVS